MKKEVIALAFSDIHLNNWTKFNQNGSRTDSHFLILDKIFREAIKQKIPVFFCGDLVHTPETINMELYIKMSKHFDKYSNEPKLQVFGISGNHEIPNLNTYDQRSHSFLTALDLQYHWFHCMDWKTIQWPTFALHGIPYLDHNIGLKQALKETKVIKGKKNILLLHTDYAGARDTDGREVGSVENFDRTLLRKFDLVLCGHIHKFQKLEKHVYMVGAPYNKGSQMKETKWVILRYILICPLNLFILKDCLSLRQWAVWRKLKRTEIIIEFSNLRPLMMSSAQKARLYRKTIRKLKQVDDIFEYKVSKILKRRDFLLKYLKRQRRKKYD